MQSNTITITPEMRRELLADWDALTRDKDSNGVAYYRLLHLFVRRFIACFGFCPHSPYMTSEGGAR